MPWQPPQPSQRFPATPSSYCMHCNRARALRHPLISAINWRWSYFTRQATAPHGPWLQELSSVKVNRINGSSLPLSTQLMRNRINHLLATHKRPWTMHLLLYIDLVTQTLLHDISSLDTFQGHMRD